jgi:hypothetical protein
MSNLLKTAIFACVGLILILMFATYVKNVSNMVGKAKEYKGRNKCEIVYSDDSMYIKSCRFGFHRCYITGSNVSGDVSMSCK